MDESQHVNITGPAGTIEDPAVFQRALTELFQAMQAVVRLDPQYRGRVCFALFMASGQKRGMLSNLPPDITAKYVAEIAVGVAEAQDDAVSIIGPQSRQ